MMRLKQLTKWLVISAGAGIASSYAAPFMAVGDTGEVFLTLDAGIRSDDNVFLSPSKIDDVIANVVPGAEFRFGNGAVSSGSISVKENFERYSDLTDLNDELFSTDASYDYSNGKTKVSLVGYYKQLNDATRDIISATLTNELVSRDVSRLSALVEFGFTQKTSVSIGASYNDTNYSTAGYLDQNVTEIPLKFYYEYSPKIDVFAGVTYRDTDLPDVLKATDFFYNVGARGEFTPKLSGSVSLGYRTRTTDFDQAGLASIDSNQFGSEVSLTYTPTEKSQIKLLYSKDFAAGAFGESIDDSTYSVNASVEFTPEFTAGVYGQYRDTDYNTGRADKYVSGSLYGSYKVTNYATVSGYYRVANNDSTIDALSFTKNVVGFSVSLRY